MQLIIRTPDTIQAWTLAYEEGMRRMEFLRQYHKNDVKHTCQHEFRYAGKTIEILQLPTTEQLLREIRLRRNYTGQP